MPSQIDYTAILDTYRSLQEQANAANEQRYGEIIDTIGSTSQRLGQTYDRVDDLLLSLGTSERGRIEQTRQRESARADQDLISRGLGNTTVRESVQRGVNEDANRLGAELTEQVSRQRAGVLTQRAGAEQSQGNFLAQMMERRTDQGPDLGMMASLLNQAGQAEAGAEAQTLFTGLSANARAGRTASGREFSSSGGGSVGAGITGGGSPQPGNRAAVYRNASNAAASRLAGGGGMMGVPAAASGGGATGGGSAFDDLFAGQQVISGLNTDAIYQGQGQVSNPSSIYSPAESGGGAASGGQQPSAGRPPWMSEYDWLAIQRGELDMSGAQARARAQGRL